MLFGSLLREIKRLVVDNGFDPFPLRHQLRGYGPKPLLSDLRAGINGALLSFPQGMAYAMLAGLPIYYGIMCSVIASVTAPLLLSSRHNVLGPTNATAFLVFTTLMASAALPVADKLQLMPLLVFMVGVLLIVGAYLRLADLIQYISRSVVVGYVTGAAVLIIISQMRHILGVQLAPEESRTFFSVLIGLIRHAREIDWQTLLTGASTAGIYFLLRTRIRSYAFPATLVGITSMVWLLQHFSPFVVPDFHSEQFRVIDLIPTLPRFSEPGIFDKISYLAGMALGLAFLVALENSVTSKTLGSHTGDRPDLNQDMLSAGVTNLFTGLFAGMPASGSMVRSTFNYNSGAQTGFASVFGGIFCLLCAVLFSDLVAYIPQAALAALIVSVAITLINRKNLRICLNATRSDAIVIITTFTTALVARLDVAVFLGTATSIALYLKKASIPHLAEYEFNQEGQLAEAQNKRQNPAISIVHVEGELFFGAAELFRTQIQRTCQDPNIKVIILRLKNARHLDATSVMALEDLIHFLRKSERHLLVSGASREVFEVLKNSGLREVLDDDAPEYVTDKQDRNLFLNNPYNPNLSTRDALIRAQQLIGTADAEIRIFYDPGKEPGAQRDS